MDTNVPPDFVPAELGEGFGSAFGPIYLNRAQNLMGFRVGTHHTNVMGSLHGGAMTTFADMQLTAIRPGAEAGRTHSPTISLSVDFVAPVNVGDWVEAKVSLVRLTRTMVFTQALMTVDGQPVARSSAIYRNYEPQE